MGITTKKKRWKGLYVMAEVEVSTHKIYSTVSNIDWVRYTQSCFRSKLKSQVIGMPGTSGFDGH